MRIAIISDIHANREALEAVLSGIDESGADKLVCLGDIVGYGADTAWCVDEIAGRASRGALVVKGNHDDAIAVRAPTMNAVAAAAIEWTRGRLDTMQTRYLADLPLTERVGPALFVHANAWAPQDWGYVTNAREAERSMDRTEATLTFCGHTHVPALYHGPAGRPAVHHSPATDVVTPLSPSMRWLAVSGSVGQPRDGRSAAAFAILDLDQRRLTFRRVAYDVEKAARKIRAARLPESLAERLFLGL